MRRYRAGFTIVELMVVIAIMGILLGIGIPSFRQLMINYKIRGFSESVLNGLQVARATAVQRNEDIEFLLATSGSNFTPGWSVRAAATSATAIQAHTPETSSPLTLTVSPANTTTVTFTGMGRVKATNADGTNPLNTINIDVPTSVLSAGESGDLRVRILSGGMVKLCDPNIAIATDVRKCP